MFALKLDGFKVRQEVLHYVHRNCRLISLGMGIRQDVKVTSNNQVGSTFPGSSNDVLRTGKWLNHKFLLSPYCAVAVNPSIHILPVITLPSGPGYAEQSLMYHWQELSQV